LDLANGTHPHAWRSLQNLSGGFQRKGDAAKDGFARFLGKSFDADVHSNPDGIHSPTIVEQGFRAIRLYIPVGGLPLFVRYVDEYVDVGISPLNLRDFSFHEYGPAHIELRAKGVVCGNGRNDSHHPKDDNQYHKASFHVGGYRELDGRIWELVENSKIMPLGVEQRYWIALGVSRRISNKGTQCAYSSRARTPHERKTAYP
jgi:hypothetical protein